MANPYYGRMIVDNRDIEAVGEKVIVPFLATKLLNEAPEGYGVTMCRIAPPDDESIHYKGMIEISFVFEPVDKPYFAYQVIENEAFHLFGEKFMINEMVDHFLSRAPEGYGVVACALTPVAGNPYVHRGKCTEVSLIFEKVPPR